MTMTTASARTPRSGTNSERGRLIARIHCLAAERKLGDDEYRDILAGITARDGGTEKRSCADCTQEELERIASLLAAASGQPASQEWEWIRSAAEEKRPLLRKIAAVCTAIGRGKAYADGVASRQTGAKRILQLCSYTELTNVAAALVRTQRYGWSKAKTARPAKGATA